MSELDYIAPRDCTLCPRLAAYLDTQRAQNPDWYNAPVPSFGPVSARLLILGLAPGRRGANATGRPFTGDGAGNTLYKALLEHRLATGSYSPDGRDDLALPDVRISNAVRCVPPQNKPTAEEIKTCRPYLQTELAKMPHLQMILSLGRISHETVLRHFGLRLPDFPFAHGASHLLPNGLYLVDSYHCSRYNTQTRRLTQTMFDDVLRLINSKLA